MDKNSLSFLSKFDPTDFFEIAKDLPNSFELKNQPSNQIGLDLNVASNDKQNLFATTTNNNNNVEITSTHILVPENSLSQMIGFQFNSNKMNENTIIDFDTEIPNLNFLDTELINQNAVASNEASCQPFLGLYGFSLAATAMTSAKNKKAMSYTFSKKLNKLYCIPGTACPIEISVCSVPPAGTTIRAEAFYSKLEHQHKRIVRCENHKKNKEFEDPNSVDQNEQIISHFIRSRHPRSIYEYNNQTLRESVVIPYERPKMGSNVTTALYQFMCYSSCIGGIQKPAKILFTLELNGEIIGCDEFEIKICACPGRDINTEEKNMDKETNNNKIAIANDNDTKPPNLRSIKKVDEPKVVEKKPQLSEIKIKSITRLDDDRDEDKIFTLEIKGRKNYEILKYLKDALEVKDMVPGLKRINSNQLNSLSYISNKSTNESLSKITRNVSITKQSSLKESPRKIKTLEQFLEYYDMIAYHKLFVNKGITSLEDLLSSNVKKINSLQISKSDTTRLLSCIKTYQKMISSKDKNVSFLLNESDGDFSIGGKRSKKRKLNESIDLTNLDGMCSKQLSFTANNTNLLQISNYKIKCSFNSSA